MKLETEAHIKTKIKKILSKYSRIWWFMPSARVYGSNGIPDFICCIKGNFFAIEAKSPQKKEKGLTALQKLQLKKISEARGYAFVVYDEATLSDLDAFLKRIICELELKEAGILNVVCGDNR